MKGVVAMDANFWITVIQSLGVPVVALGCAFWFINKETDAHRQERKELEEAHTEAEAQLREVIANNTLVMQKLCDKLDTNGKE